MFISWPCLSLTSFGTIQVYFQVIEPDLDSIFGCSQEGQAGMEFKLKQEGQAGMGVPR